MSQKKAYLALSVTSIVWGTTWVASKMGINHMPAFELASIRQFLGGSISPGTQMRFRAMHEQTALLPLITPSLDFPLVGYDTKTNLLSGVVWGMAAEINGIIEAYEAKYSNFNVQLTGGDLSYFVPRLKKRIFADPNLIFKGLYAISETNQ